MQDLHLAFCASSPTSDKLVSFFFDVKNNVFACLTKRTDDDNYGKYYNYDDNDGLMMMMMMKMFKRYTNNITLKSKYNN